MITIEIRGLADVLGRLGRLSQPLTPVASRVRIALHNQHERRVASEKTDPDGRAWAPLAPSTVRRKRGGSLLIDTSRLLNSMVSRQSGLTLAESNQAAPYNAFINSGTRHMPARVFMGLGSSGIDEIEKICLTMIARRLQ